MRHLHVMPLAALALAGSAAGCKGGNRYGYSGFALYHYFPLDGQRSWEYVSDDFSYKLVVEKTGVERKRDFQIVQLDYSEQDPATQEKTLDYSIKWSSDSTNGVLVHGVKVEGQDTDWQTFDTPVELGKNVVKGDQTTTETNGTTFTSTFVGVEDCPNNWVTDTWQCLHITIDDEGAGYPFSGDYWLAASWGPSRFTPTGQSNPWVLAKGDFTPEDTGQ